jgi:CheY-like chemotaxis protein
VSEKILVVDDDANFSRLLETILRGEGYSVEIASVHEATARG